MTYGQSVNKAQNGTSKIAVFSGGFMEYGTTDWMTKTYTFTATADMDQKYLTVVPAVSTGSEVTFDIDYIKVTTSYVVDFDDAGVYSNWMHADRTGNTYINAASQVAYTVENSITEKKMDVKILRKNGALTVNINGKAYPPLSFKSFRPDKQNISDFYKAGIRLFNILTSGVNCAIGIPYSLFGESWVGKYEYDFAPVDSQIELFIENGGSLLLG